MDIIDKAKELGKMIVESEEFIVLKENEASLEKDEKSIELMKDYQTMQSELMELLQSGKTGDEVDKLKEKFMAKQDEISKYEVTKSFLEARSNFENLMKKVNDVIGYMVSGNEEAGCDSESGCSSCGGGCGGH